MAEIIRMPRMSDTMEEGNIVEWLKEEGDEVEPGDVLAEVETDKATMELESYHEGVLLHIGVKEGAVPVNAVIAVIGEEGEDYEQQLKEAEEQSEESEDSQDDSEEQQSKEDSTEKKSSQPAESTKKEETTPSSTSDDPKRIKASPLAKKMAEENKVDLSNVKGSGDNGRIVKRDIETYLEDRPTTSQVAAPDLAIQAEDKELEVSQMRKTIARRLSESKFTSPHFYLTSEVNMDASITARERINSKDDVKVSFNDLIVKACAVALQQHPMVNASWTDKKIIQHGNINIGVAVAVEEGLVVPVLRNANLKTLTQINAEVKEKAGKAREKKLTTEEMQGNTFTISNLGMFDIDEFTAIINPPDACILAVGSIIEKPIVKDGEIKVGHTMKMTLSCDHRIVDGVTGARFLKTVKSFLEEPIRMIV